MGDMAEIFKLMKEQDRQRRERNLENADPKGWTLHTPYHWSRDLNGSRLDYWPTKNKFKYEDRVMCGDVEGFIRNRRGEE